MRFTTTPEQDYILAILKATGIMRKTQAVKLLDKLGGCKGESHWERCFRQLGHIRKIAWVSDGLFTLPLLRRAPVDGDMLRAIDIMADLTDARVRAVTASTPPYKLCFLAEQRKGFGSYSIAIARPGAEALLTAAMQNHAQDGRTVVFLLSSPSQAGLVKTPLPHFFAVPEGGGYRYYTDNCQR